MKKTVAVVFSIVLLMTFSVSAVSAAVTKNVEKTDIELVDGYDVTLNTRFNTLLGSQSWFAYYTGYDSEYITMENLRCVWTAPVDDEDE